jgi:hypothetical protein
MLVVYFASGAMLACAHPRQDQGREVSVESIRDAQPEAVATCSFVAVLHGKGGWPGAMGVQKAMLDVREQAAERGATHLVWKYATAGVPGVAEAEAFRCSDAKR